MGLAFTFLCVLGIVAATLVSSSSAKRETGRQIFPFRDSRFRRHQYCEDGFTYDPTNGRCAPDVTCADDQFLDRTTLECRTVTCPPEYALESLTKRCNWNGTCSEGQYYDRRLAGCVSCRDGSHYNDLSERCELDEPCQDDEVYDPRYQECRPIPCAPGYSYSVTDNGCVRSVTCGDDQFFDSSTGECRDIACPLEHVFNPERRRCEWDGTCPEGQYFERRFSGCLSCKEGSHYDEVNARCEPDEPCQADTFYDEFTQRCMPCGPGYLSDGRGCSYGFRNSPRINHLRRGHVQCPPHQHFDAELRSCVESK